MDGDFQILLSLVENLSQFSVGCMEKSLFVIELRHFEIECAANVFLAIEK